jgi:hypothetical protein
MHHALRFFLALLLPAATLLPPAAAAQSPSPQRAPENVDSLAREVRRAMASLSTPELERRKELRREFQQRGYAEILSARLAGDGTGALLAYLRMALQLEFFLPRNTLYVYLPVAPPGRTDSAAYVQRRSAPIAVPLRENRSYPEDPWAR